MTLFDHKKFKSLRQGAKLTQSQLAKKAETDNSTISRVERGQQQPTEDVARRLAVVLGVEPLSLWKRQKPAQAPSAPEQPAEAPSAPLEPAEPVNEARSTEIFHFVQVGSLLDGHLILQNRADGSWWTAAPLER